MRSSLVIDCVAGAGLSIGKEAPAIAGVRIDQLCNSLRQMIPQPYRVFAPDVTPDPATHRLTEMGGMASQR